MIAADTSALIAYFRGDRGRDTDLIENALVLRGLLLPPAVLSELLSDPVIEDEVRKVLLALPLIDVQEGYWHRVGEVRAKLLQKKLRARLADSLIAVSCIDSNVALITRDKDYRHFKRFCGLRLA